jgi:putative ATP-dependent endonuclease of OLD family
MKLHHLRLSNFQSFGPEATKIEFDDLTFLIGPNGSGKTAVLQALCRLFAFDPSLKRLQRSDFHVPFAEPVDVALEQRVLWIEAEFVFPELEADDQEHAAIPPHFAHMRLDTLDGVPRVRFRLDATLSADGEIEEHLQYVLDVDAEGRPLNQYPVPRPDRNNIHVHYLPARRDPSDHIAYTASALVGRALRAVNWQAERETISELAKNMNSVLAANSAVASLSCQLTEKWKRLHEGSFFSDPQVTFAGGNIESLLRHLSIAFSPGHGEHFVDFSRLSDGQKSVLYLSLVLSIQAIGRAALGAEAELFDVDKLKPAIFTIVAMEEPENSLSPHYLGRVIKALSDLGAQEDAQSLIATHAPSMLRRVAPENIRYLRLSSSRQSQVATILIPSEADEARKFVREAVQAFPELYFSRLVVLAEGDSEEVVLPRLLGARGLAVDEAAISVVPLGGRHVNHFWRLLGALDIPFITLLDLDLGRHGGGWGRVRYVAKNLLAFSAATCDITQAEIDSLPEWDLDEDKLLESEPTSHWLSFLESKDVFFSSPLDLDFAMLNRFPAAFGVTAADSNMPPENKIKSVLGDNYHGIEQYSTDEKKLFTSYHKLFKLGSKPVAHLNALAELQDEELGAQMPTSLSRLVDAAKVKLEGLPE